MKKKIELVMAVCVLLAAAILAKEGSVYVASKKAEEAKTTIVIDPGHGGDDPGKVGINDALEKDINIKIALEVGKLLEKEDYQVVFTREKDEGLYDADATNKKVQDLQRRVEIMNTQDPACVISIHQNSYDTSDVCGAQVFYHTQSEKGKALAEILQKTLMEELDPQNQRVAKANESYYILKNTTAPTVIVECGFLSNQEEADLLITESYQKKAAKAIVKGVLEFVKTMSQ